MTSPVLGTVLLVGVVMASFGSALAMTWTFCPGCMDTAGVQARNDPWSYCNDRPFETPACADGEPVISEGRWCYQKEGLTILANGTLAPATNTACAAVV